MTDKIIDLPEWAEDSFARLCSAAGVTRNKSGQDRTGWDYLVEFKPDEAIGLPADMQPVERAARVQIKSKEKGKPSVSLRLQNARRYAKDPLPCFVILFVATDGGTPVRIFAKHFWEDEIRRTLLRARKAHDAENDDVSRLSITLSFSADDDHSDDLIEWMAGVVRDGGDGYGKKKLEMASTIGFDEGHIQGQICFKAADLGALVDHQIGLVPTAPPISITLRQSRFGILARKPLFEGIPDTTHMQSLPVPARIRVRGVRADIWLDGLMFRPSIPNLPLQHRKLRIVAGFIEMLGEGASTGTLKLNINHDRRRSLPELRALVDVLEAASAGPLHLSILTDDTPPIDTSVRIDPLMPDADREQLSNVITCLELVSNNILPADLTLTLDEVDAAWNHIVDFNGMVTGSDLRGRFELASDLPAEYRDPAFIYFYDYVDIGDWSFLAVVRRPVKSFAVDGAKGTLETDRPRVVEAMVVRGKGSDHLAPLRAAHQRAVKAERSPILEFYGGDYRALREHGGETNVILHTPD